MGITEEFLENDDMDIDFDEAFPLRRRSQNQEKEAEEKILAAKRGFPISWYDSR